MMHVGFNAESREYIAIQKPDHLKWRVRLRRVFQTRHILTGNGLRSTHEGELDFGMSNWGISHGADSHQSQSITNQPLQLRSRGAVQLLQSLINF